MSDGSPLDARLYLNEELVQADAVPFVCGNASVVSRRCPGAEGPNQDAAALLPATESSGLLVVADGLGGGPAGERAAALAVQCLREALSAHEADDLRPAVLDGIEAANQEILAVGDGSATTVSVVEVHDGSIRPYHVGDSLILVVGQRGLVKYRSTPHSPVGYAVAAGVLDEHEALHHEQLHVVANVVGCEEMTIEVGAPRPLAKRDTVVLASDGLADNLAENEIVELVRRGKLPTCVTALADAASARMHLEPNPPSGLAVPESDHEILVDQLPSKPDDLTIVAFRR